MNKQKLWALVYGLGLAAAFSTGTSIAQAQAPASPATTPDISVLGKPPISDSATVTIFGRSRTYMSPNETMIDRSSASSCGFMDNYDVGSDPVYQNYMGGFSTGGMDRSDHFSTSSPFGDASRPSNDRFGSDRDSYGRGGSDSNCGPSARGFAAGRAFIAAHDHSLKDAFAAFDAKDYPKALTLFRASYSKMGFPAAAFMVGKMYLFGTGVPRDTAQAIVWLKKVADSGAVVPGTPPQFNPDDPEFMTTRADATMTLARIYLVGWDVPKDPKQARKWYSLADKIGHVPATHIMGTIYKDGFSVEPDVKQAVIYYKKAASVGYAPSQYALGEIYYFGDDGNPPDKVKAGAWLLEAAKHKYPDALFAVARMYDLGEGGAKVNPQTALYYYKEAAIKGQVEAQNVIALAFYTGQGVDKDLPTARKWFEKAAEGGSTEAMFNLGVMMANGEGGDKDLIKAYALFSVAQKNGLEKAGPALAELGAKLTPEQRAQADALLNPPPKS
jgi:TPR repeat protein